MVVDQVQVVALRKRIFRKVVAESIDETEEEEGIIFLNHADVSGEEFVEGRGCRPTTRWCPGWW